MEAVKLCLLSVLLGVVRGMCTLYCLTYLMSNLHDFTGLLHDLAMVCHLDLIVSSLVLAGGTCLL